ncbi:dipeptide ABC transporter ATP-binding protein [Bacillus luteolus]|uniref:Dipeptide ABC transporter ATP-binding protein n=1 Tax=Litchfieldia luteola TaxID=682179 RepID=A0ABR9QJ45_9BACI|nr:dipeptide ABC transporter ATP-binding protein [Cytobacillus luteolus]MBE4908527.1 dipeptide ABC transporter ATP-binding protein [Cytobacillus luteolus]MBP1941379.1 oligopeptide/dipeptide ABC transporter ATP-binding protein [Cytobacillus luteolus]
MAERLLEVENLKKWFPVEGKGLLSKGSNVVKAVDDISFYIEKGETLGLVGESGCGKSTAGRVILRLIEATEGRILIENEDLRALSANKLKKKRKDMQIVFQDPYASLNPRLKVGKILEEPMSIHLNISKKERKERVKQIMSDVGLNTAYIDRYPHEFSGGQRQRIGIARALAVNPKLIIMDEPVSALDVSVQAQVLNLIQDLQEKYSLTYLFITHNLSVVKHISNRIAVMYLGKIVEIADRDEFFENPKHPYSEALLSAIPKPNPKLKRQRIILNGDIPSPVNPPSGCRFHTRCPYAMDICKSVSPELRNTGNQHFVACHLDEL